MWRNVCVGALVIGAGCFSSHSSAPEVSSGGSDAGPDGSSRIAVRDASSGRVPRIEASIASVSLADDCAVRSAGVGAPVGELVAGDCAPDPDSSGCSFCQQSSLQLNLRVDGDEPGYPTSIVDVILYDADGTKVLDHLETSSPRYWSDSEGYQPWDEQLSSGTDLRVSYHLSAPEWAALTDGDAWRTYEERFQVRVVVQIGAQQVTLEAVEVTREPPIVT